MIDFLNFIKGFLLASFYGIIVAFILALGWMSFNFLWNNLSTGDFISDGFILVIILTILYPFYLKIRLISEKFL
jgi:hypothetical protein